MKKTVIINGVPYETGEVVVPLASDPTQEVSFFETSDGTAPEATVLDGETYYAEGEKREGTMPNNGDVSGVISTKDGTVNIPAGYTPGGTVMVSDTEKSKLIPANIRQGVTIMGVQGGMSPSEGVNAQTKTVTPTKVEQVIQPDSGYTHLAQVVMAAIPAQYPDTGDADIEDGDLKKGKIGYGKNGKRKVGTHTDPEITLANGVLRIK